MGFFVNYNEFIDIKHYSNFLNISLNDFFNYFDFSLIFYIYKKFYNCFRIILF